MIKGKESPQDLIELVYNLTKPGHIIGGNKRMLYHGSEVKLPRWRAESALRGGKFITKEAWDKAHMRTTKKAKTDTKPPTSRSRKKDSNYDTANNIVDTEVKDTKGDE